VVVFKNDKWVPGKIIRKADSPKSYWVKVGSGSIIRRNIWHLNPSFNTFRELNYNEYCEENENSNIEESQTKGTTVVAKTNESRNIEESQIKESEVVAKTTKCGRLVKKPDKLNL
jgi:hypothetical protein